MASLWQSPDHLVPFSVSLCLSFLHVLIVSSQGSQIQDFQAYGSYWFSSQTYESFHAAIPQHSNMWTMICVSKKVLENQNEVKRVSSSKSTSHLQHFAGSSKESSKGNSNVLTVQIYLLTEKSLDSSLGNVTCLLAASRSFLASQQARTSFHLRQYPIHTTVLCVFLHCYITFPSSSVCDSVPPAANKVRRTWKINAWNESRMSRKRDEKQPQETDWQKIINVWNIYP